MNKLVIFRIPNYTFSRLLIDNCIPKNKTIVKESSLALIKESIYLISHSKKFNSFDLSYIEREINFKKSSTKSTNISFRLTLGNYDKNIYLEENFYHVMDNSNKNKIYTNEKYDVILKDFKKEDSTQITKWRNDKNDNFYAMSCESPIEIRQLYKEITQDEKDKIPKFS